MNNVVLIGRLTKDPELRYIPQNEMAVANFTLAVDRPMAKEKTADFIKVVVFGKSAENCEKYLVKGRLCGVEGRIQTGSYDDKESGKKVYTTEVYANRVEFIEWGEKVADSGEKGVAKGKQEYEGFQAIEEDDPDSDIPF